MFFIIVVLKNCAIFARKAPVLESLFNKIAYIKRYCNTDCVFADFIVTPYFERNLNRRKWYHK